MMHHQRLVFFTLAAAAAAPRLIKPVRLASKQSSKPLTRRGGKADTRPASELLSPAETLVAGALARLCAQTLLHPLDVVRTRTQAKSRGDSTLLQALPFGLAPQVLLAAPAGSVQFAAVKALRGHLERCLPEGFTESPGGRFCTQLLAAAGGAACAGVIRVPQEVLKQGCMVELYPNAASAAATIARETGVAGFYKGAVATLSRDILWNSFSFALFRVFLDAAAALGAASDLGNYLLGILAGCTAACLTHPIDVAKTRIMTSTVASGGSLVTQLKDLVDAEGWSVLLLGLKARLLYLGPLASLVLATNEVIASIIVSGR